MTWIKICGITNVEDALMAVEAGADALGFVFYEKSPRKIDPGTVRQIVAELPSHVEKVGVFVHRGADQATRIAEESGLTALQVHLQASDPEISLANTPLVAVASSRRRKLFLVLPATWAMGEGPVALNLSSFVERRPERPFDTIFLDSGTPEQPGGTGKPFEWARAAPVVEEMRKSVNVVIAGGLTPANVAEAIRILKPWGVDVASGVEASPGKKDSEKVRAFVAAARSAGKGT